MWLTLRPVNRPIFYYERKLFGFIGIRLESPAGYSLQQAIALMLVPFCWLAIERRDF